MNAVALCYGCHQHFHAHPLEHTDWFKKRIGEKEFDLLILRANSYGKPDVKLIRMWLRAELNKLKKKNYYE